MGENAAGLYAVALYSGLLGLVYLWLLAIVGKTRGDLKISIGDGGDPYMIRVMRGQLNFVENVPLTLVFLVLMALIGTPVWVLHVFGLALLVGRILHGLHFTKRDAPGWQRAAGAGLTNLTQLFIALGLIAHAIAGLF
ncbi:MAG: MAPEG family protein [Pseudomonadota bacterium]